MKRFMQFVLALTLAITIFAVENENVAASEVCTTNHQVVVHYSRWDNDYTGLDFWTWGTGTNGSSAPVLMDGTSGFGVTATFCIDDDADNTAGLIARNGDWSYKDGIMVDGSIPDKSIILKEGEEGSEVFVGFDENGVKNVYLYQGSEGVIYESDANSLPWSPTLATIAVVYFDAAQSYDAWNIWTWGVGTNGTQIGDAGPYGGSGIPLQASFGVDQSEVVDYKVAFINVDPTDMDAEIGFIMRTDSWEKKEDGDMFISTEGLAAGDVKTVFYIAGSGMFYDNFADFEAESHKFELSIARAINPKAVNVEFNKDIIIKTDDEVVFDASFFRVFDKNHGEVAISSVNYDTTLISTKQFTVVFEENLDPAMGPYVIKYNDGVEFRDTWVIDYDTTAPEIRIIGSTEVTLELGDTYAMPAFSAFDTVGDESVPVYDVYIVEGKGTVDTRNAGVYEIVIEAVDSFGNVAQETITVTVIDICLVDTDVYSANPMSLIALLAGLPLAAGAMFAFKRN